MVALNQVHKQRLVRLNQMIKPLLTDPQDHILEVVIVLVTLFMRVHHGLQGYGVVIGKEVKLVVVVKVVVVVVGITVLVVPVTVMV